MFEIKTHKRTRITLLFNFFLSIKYNIYGWKWKLEPVKMLPTCVWIETHVTISIRFYLLVVFYDKCHHQDFVHTHSHTRVHTQSQFFFYAVYWFGKFDFFYAYVCVCAVCECILYQIISIRVCSNVSEAEKKTIW